MTNLSQPPDHDMTEATVPVVPAAEAGTPAGTPTGERNAAVASGAETPGPLADPAKESAQAHSDIDLLLRQAEEAIASVDKTVESSTDGTAPFPLRELSGSPASTEIATVDLLRDVELDLRIELGRTHLDLEEVLKLRRGSVVALDKLAGDPVDIYVNGRLIARGEVLVLNDNFCVRVAELVAGDGV